jgi:hypothetical protein
MARLEQSVDQAPIWALDGDRHISGLPMATKAPHKLIEALLGVGEAESICSSTVVLGHEHLVLL